jgi:hypothetical protein
MVHPALKLTPEPGLVPPLSDFDEILRRMLAEVKAGRKSCAKIGLGTVLSLSSPTRRGPGRRGRNFETQNAGYVKN